MQRGAPQRTEFKVGIDVTGALAPGTGIGRHTLGLLQGLREVEPDLDLVLFANSLRAPWNPAHPLLAGTVNPRIPARVLLGLWRRFSWPPIEAFTGALDVFHTSDWIHPPQRGGATVVTVHDLAALVHPEWYAGDVVEIHRRKNQAAVERATLIMADSEHTRADFLRLFPIEPSRVRVVPLGVSAEFRAPPVGLVRTIRQRYGLQRPYILYVGTRERRKNLPGLVEIFSLVAGHDTEVELAVVGTRPWAEGTRVHGSEVWTQGEFEARADELGVAGRIHVLGQVPMDELLGLYAGARVLAFPSLYEGFGLPVLEAMACGLPVVGSNRSSVPEVIGEAGIVADPERPREFAEQVLQLLGDRQLRDEYRARGLERAARFTWGATARAVMGVYREANEQARG